MMTVQTKYFLLKGIPIVALLLYLILTFLALTLEQKGGGKWVWAMPFGYGLLALIAGDPMRRRIGVTYKWLSAYTRSLGALYAATAFGIALL